jgi:hypothetical protein
MANSSLYRKIDCTLLALNLKTLDMQRSALASERTKVRRIYNPKQRCKFLAMLF